MVAVIFVSLVEILLIMAKASLGKLDQIAAKLLKNQETREIPEHSSSTPSALTKVRATFC